MTPEERTALEQIRRAGRLREIRYTRHARERMNERGVSDADVQKALASAGHIRPGDGPGRWRVVGYGADRRQLAVVVALERGAIVITVHDA